MPVDIPGIVEEYLQDVARLSINRIIEQYVHDIASLPNSSPTFLHAILQKALVADHELRRLFATDPQHRCLDNLYVGLINVFNVPEVARLIQSRDVSPTNISNQYIFPLDSSVRKPKLSPCTVPDMNAFLHNWEIFTHRVLCKMTAKHWENVVAAGGSVLASLMAVPPHTPPHRLNEFYLGRAWGMSDIDLFLFGLSPEEAEIKIRDIYEVVCASAPWRVTCVRTAATISFRTEYPYRPVQIVLRVYRSPAEILAGFDVDCSCCAFDGKTVWVNPRSLTALLRQVNTIDVTRRSPSYEVRLAKYAERGFEVFVPSLSRNKVNPTIYDHYLQSFPNGLARLLVLERLYENPIAYFFLTFPWSRVEIEEDVAAGVGDPLEGVTSDAPDLLRSYYDTDLRWTPIPYGPKWNAQWIERLIARKDAWLNSPFNRVNDGRQTHKHLIFAGSFEDCINGTFCERCNNVRRVNHYVESDTTRYIQGHIEFMTLNPGRHLATGSFQPIDDDEWERDAYAGVFTVPTSSPDSTLQFLDLSRTGTQNLRQSWTRS